MYDEQKYGSSHIDKRFMKKECSSPLGRTEHVKLLFIFFWVGFSLVFRVAVGVRIPASVKKLGRKAFARNPYLSTVTIEGTSRSFEEVGLNLFYETCGITDVIINVTNDLETMIVLPKCAKVTNVTVAGGLVSKAWLSSNCDYLTSLRVSNDKIPTKAWKGCASLNNIDFDGNVMEIDSHAFEGCSALVAVRFACLRLHPAASVLPCRHAIFHHAGPCKITSAKLLIELLCARCPTVDRQN